MRRKGFAEMACSTAQALEVVGEWWSILILREAFLGVRRFDDFARNLGIARNVLSARLGRLVEHGVFERTRYQDRPPRYEYRLTACGRDLYPVLIALMEWGDRWKTPPGGPPVRLRHRGCGEHTTPHLVCDRCGEAVGPYDTVPEPGPGATAASVEDRPLVGRGPSRLTPIRSCRGACW